MRDNPGFPGRLEAHLKMWYEHRKVTRRLALGHDTWSVGANCGTKSVSSLRCNKTRGTGLFSPPRNLAPRGSSPTFVRPDSKCRNDPFSPLCRLQLMRCVACTPIILPSITISRGVQTISIQGPIETQRCTLFVCSLLYRVK
jgi:hypothetical protein